MKILLLGKFGQLGWELERTLQCLGQVLAYDYPEIDFMNPSALRQKVLDFCPQIVVNAAAYTEVDKAEAEKNLARTINTEAPALLAAICRSIGAAFIHYSTDYVFDGKKGSQYEEDDLPNPLNYYGITKLEGEKAVLAAGCSSLIFRTAWLYSLRRDSFVTKVLHWARTQKEIYIVEDQVSSPTWARLLAEITADILSKALPEPVPWLSEHAGIYHLAGNGFASRLEWASSILRNDPHKSEHLVKVIIPAQSKSFVTPASRPSFSALNCDRFEQTFALSLPQWEDALRLALAS